MRSHPTSLTCKTLAIHALGALAAVAIAATYVQGMQQAAPLLVEQKAPLQHGPGTLRKADQVWPGDKVDDPWGERPHGVRYLAFSPDSKILVVGRQDGLLSVCEVATGKRRKLGVNERTQELLYCSSNKSVVASSDWNNESIMATEKKTPSKKSKIRDLPKKGLTTEQVKAVKGGRTVSGKHITAGL